MNEPLVELKRLDYENSEDLDTINLRRISVDFVSGRSLSARLRLCLDVLMRKKPARMHDYRDPIVPLPHGRGR